VAKRVVYKVTLHMEYGHAEESLQSQLFAEYYTQRIRIVLPYPTFLVSYMRSHGSKTKIHLAHYLYTKGWKKVSPEIH